MALTDTLIRQLKPKSKAYSMTDLEGLSLFVAVNGRKSWHFRFSWQGKQPRISLGTYPELSLKEARQLRDKARSQVAKGVDPRCQRPQFIDDAIVIQEKPCISFAGFSDVWKQLKLKKLGIEKSERRQSTKIQIDRYLHKDMLPILGHLPLDKITREQVLQVQRKIEKRGALSIAEKCRSWLNEIFRHAMAEGLITQNPASDLDIVALPQHPTQHNPFLRLDELPPFLQKLSHYQGAMTTKLGLYLLLLTGVRTGELRQAEPKHFDLDAGIWAIPADAVKQLKKRVRTGNNTIPPYIVPLSTQAISVVKQLLSLRYAKQPYLLCHSYDPTRMISENTLNSGLRRMGYKNKLTGHGMRATLSTALNESGYPKEWIEAQLSHSDKDQIRATYNHAQYVEQRRKMMQDWATRLDNMTHTMQ